MRTVNMNEAKTHLSRLVDLAVNGEPFIIARAGKPLVKVTRIDASAKRSRASVVAGETVVSDDAGNMAGDAKPVV